MPDQRAHDASAVDWDRLRSFARRVARETTVPPSGPITYRGSAGNRVEAVGPHWLLDVREHHIEDAYPAVVETEHQFVRMVLMPDGAIDDVIVMVEERQQLAGRVSTTYALSHHLRSFDGSSDPYWGITRLDFEKQYHESSGKRRTWGDVFPGSDRRLTASTKGEGIFRTLHELLSGHPSGGADGAPPWEKYAPTVTPANPPSSAAPRTPARRSNAKYLIPLMVVAVIIVCVAGVLALNSFNRADHPSAQQPSPSIRQIVDHATIAAPDVNNVIRGMGIGSCWNAQWSWTTANQSYMPIALPSIVDCSAPDATQRLDMISDNCRGTGSEMAITQRALFDGQAHCFILAPSEGMCIPAAVNGGRADYTGTPVVCDSPPSPRYPSLFKLVRRLSDQNDQCDQPLYYLWLDAVNTGFCYSILT